jgi:hypothetical protein
MEVGFAKLIAVGRIEEILVGFDIAVEHTPWLVAVGAVAPICPEHAGAKNKLRHAKTGVLTEDFVPHGVFRLLTARISGN